MQPNNRDTTSCDLKNRLVQHKEIKIMSYTEFIENREKNHKSSEQIRKEMREKDLAELLAYARRMDEPTKKDSDK